MSLSIASQSSVSASGPNYSFNIGNSLSVLCSIVVLDSLNGTSHINLLACYQYWHSTDGLEQVCCHHLRSNNRSNHVVVNSNSCFCFDSCCPSQQCRINQRRYDVFLSLEIYIFGSIADELCYIINNCIFLYWFWSYSNIGNLYVEDRSMTNHVSEFFVRYLTLAYMTLYQFLGCLTHCIYVLAMIVCCCTYGGITIQIVGCLEGC